jgi:hypothetical protein
MPSWLSTLTGLAGDQLGSISPPGWITIGLAGCWVFIRRVLAYRREPKRDKKDRAERINRAILIAAIALMTVVFASFVIGTLQGSKNFAVDKLDWVDWMKFIPWGALDAGSLGFSLFSVLAVRMGKSPVKAMKIAAIFATASGLVQLSEGGQKHLLVAGAFLAFLAIMLAVGLHTITDLIHHAGIKIEDVRERKYPPFGIRWITSFPSTLCALLAWANHPVDGLRPTRVNSLEHLENVRAAKRARMLGRPWWWWLNPYLYASRATGNLDEWITRVRVVRDESAAAAALSDLALAERNAELETNRTEALAESVRAAERISELNRELNSARELIAERERTEQNLSAQFAAERAELELKSRAAAERAELAISALRTEIDELNARRTEPAVRRRPELAATRVKQQSVGTLVSDAEIANRLQKWFGEQTELTGKPPTRYRIELTAPCSSRQADRVLLLLANRYAAQNAAPNRTENGSSREPNRIGEPNSGDSELDRAELNRTELVGVPA